MLTHIVEDPARSLRALCGEQIHPRHKKTDISSTWDAATCPGCKKIWNDWNAE